VCAYHFAHLSYTTQHRAVLITFPLILQTSIRAQLPSIGGEGACAPCHYGRSVTTSFTDWQF